VWLIRSFCPLQVYRWFSAVYCAIWCVIRNPGLLHVCRIFAEWIACRCFVHRIVQLLDVPRRPLFAAEVDWPTARVRLSLLRPIWFEGCYCVGIVASTPLSCSAIVIVWTASCIRAATILTVLWPRVECNDCLGPFLKWMRSCKAIVNKFVLFRWYRTRSDGQCWISRRFSGRRRLCITITPFWMMVTVPCLLIQLIFPKWECPELPDSDDVAARGARFWLRRWGCLRSC